MPFKLSLIRHLSLSYPSGVTGPYPSVLTGNIIMHLRYLIIMHLRYLIVKKRMTCRVIMRSLEYLIRVEHSHAETH